MQSQSGIDAVRHAGRPVPGVPHVPLVQGDADLGLQPLAGLADQLPHAADGGQALVVFPLHGIRGRVLGRVPVIVLAHQLGDAGERPGRQLGPLLAGVGPRGTQTQIGRGLQHLFAVLQSDLAVAPGGVVPLHVAVAKLVAQGPELHVVGLFPATLLPQPPILRGAVPVAVLHPGGVLLRGAPAGVDGEEGLGPDLPAQGDKVVGVDLAVIVAHSVGLGLQSQIGLEGRPHIHREQAVHPVELPGEIAAGPAQDRDPQLFQLPDYVPAHAPEIVFGQQGEGPKADASPVLPGDAQVRVRVRGVGAQLHLNTGPIVPLRPKFLAAVYSLAGPVCQGDGKVRPGPGLYHSAEQILPVFGNGNPVLPQAHRLPGHRAKDAQGVALHGALHVVALPVAGVGLVKGEDAPLANGVPLQRAALAGGGLAGEFPVAQHLGGKASVQAGAGVL